MTAPDTTTAPPIDSTIDSTTSTTDTPPAASSDAISPQEQLGSQASVTTSEPVLEIVTELVPEPVPEPTLAITVSAVARIRELLDVVPATDAAIVGQIRALLPALV